MAEDSPSPGKPQLTNATLADRTPEEVQRFWIGEIERAQKYFEPWWETSDRIVERYRDERGRNDGVGQRTSEGNRVATKRFNIMWSNIQTMFPALYTDPPEPMVNRRYKDEDPLARLAVELSERGLRYVQDPADEECSYDSACRSAVLDYLLTGRGIPWVRYEREVEEVSEEGFDDGGEAIETVVSEEVTEEKLYHDHVQYRHFIHMIAPSWDMVLKRGWAARLHFLTKPEVAEQFGTEAAEAVQLTATDTATADGRVSRNSGEPRSSNPKYAQIWEIWNVPDRKVYFISVASLGLFSAGSKPLDVRDDPLGLTNFFPCPRPLFATTTPDTMVPVPDYVEYADQAENLDRITDKKWKLTTALRVVGFYAGNEAQSIQQIFDGTDRNIMVPVQDWAHIQDAGGVSGLITYVPIDMVVQTLRELQAQEEDNKQQVYEITGIADIIRGQTKASETLGAQRIKGQWASVRLADRQRLVGKLCRDVLRIDAEIIAEHFDPKTIAEMTNFSNTRFAKRPEYQGAFMAAVQLLRDDRMRNFRVDVETEDTVFADQMQERQQTVEMIGSIGQFLQAAAEIGPALPESVPVLGEMLKIGLASFSGSKARQLETYVDEMVARLNDRVKKQMENPQPSPEEMEAQAQAQKDQADAQDKQAGRKLEQQGQVLDFKGKTRDQALEKRQQDLQFLTANRDRLANILSDVARAQGSGGNA